MAGQWVPVLAALLGILGGMGGAAVGGYVANEGQEQRFKQEQATQIRNLRIATYVKFLRATQNELDGEGVDDRIVRSAEAEVVLVAPGAVRKAAATLTDEAIEDHEEEYNEARERFIDMAQAEIGTGS
jgi:hypothetical protein